MANRSSPSAILGPARGGDCRRRERGAQRPGGRARYIRSDISLAPGNSGGPLLNARGKVVGINVMIFGGLALSIPSNTASAWLAGERRLGVRVRPVELPAALNHEDRTRETGLVILATERDGPADRAGLLVGDVLLGAGDEPVRGVESLLDPRAGSIARLNIVRGGEVSSIDVDLGPGRAA